MIVDGQIREITTEFDSHHVPPVRIRSILRHWIMSSTEVSKVRFAGGNAGGFQVIIVLRESTFLTEDEASALRKRVTNAATTLSKLEPVFM